MGSVALLGFYMVLKYVGKEWINLILGVYCESDVLLVKDSWEGFIIRRSS